MSSEYLMRVPSTTGNQQKFTISTWVKRSVVGPAGNPEIYRADATGAGSAIRFDSTDMDCINIFFNYPSVMVTTYPKVYRDTSQWYHVVLSVDTTQSVASDRIKLYVNGSRETLNTSGTSGSGYTYTWPTQNFAVRGIFEATVKNGIGSQGTGGEYMQGQMFDFYAVDGLALDASYFGRTNTNKNGQWVPKHPTQVKSAIVSAGGFGTNGCYIPMSQHNVSIPEVTGNYTLARRSAGDVSGDTPNTTLKKSFAFNNGNNNSNTALQTSSNLGSANVIGAAEDFTIEFWIKYTGNAATNERILANYSNISDACYDIFIAGSSRSIQDFGANVNYGISLRDSQWDHVVICRQSGTGRYYLNGAQQSFAANTKTYGNGNYKISVGGPASDNNLGAAYGLSNGIIAALKIRKGVCSYPNGTTFTPPTSFTNDSGTIFLLQDTTNLTIGSDLSGTTNNGFTAMNLQDTTRTTKDSISNNFATMNSLAGFDGTQTKGGLIQTAMNDCLATMGFKSGKFYWEHKILTYAGAGNVLHFGVKNGDYNSGINVALSTPGIHYRNDGQITRVAGNSCSSWSGADIPGGSGVSTAVGDIIGVAVDTVSSPASVVFYKNGSAMHSYTFTYSNTAYYMVPYVRNNSGCSSEQNFGQGTFVTSNGGVGYTDANGKGKFQYAPPTGFLALCEDNIPDISFNPKSHFKVVTYNGNGSTQAVTGVGFQPDFLMIKTLSGANTWYWRFWDSNRGAWPTGKGMYSNTIEVEGTWEDNTGGGGASGDLLTSFDADGFTVQTNGTSFGLNQTSHTYIAYCFKAGGTAVTNTSGTVSSQVSANTTSGFSIVKFTSPASGNFTVGHGLNAKPDVIFAKARNGNTFNWSVYFTGMGDTNFLRLNTTDTAITVGSSIWGGTSNINATTISFNSGNGIEASKNCIAYCWASTPGFSKVGTYIGNSTGLTFVYTGFRPAFVMIKPWTTDTTPTTGWRIFDNAKNTYNTNGSQNSLYFNTSGNQVGQNGIDFVADGFYLINSSGDVNHNRGNCTYYYMAFAEQPFDFANAR